MARVRQSKLWYNQPGMVSRRYRCAHEWTLLHRFEPEYRQYYETPERTFDMLWKVGMDIHRCRRCGEVRFTEDPF